jgi:hypothetical protein
MERGSVAMLKRQARREVPMLRLVSDTSSAPTSFPGSWNVKRDGAALRVAITGPMTVADWVDLLYETRARLEPKPLAAYVPSPGSAASDEDGAILMMIRDNLRAEGIHVFAATV